MKLIRLILIVAFTVTGFAGADLPKSLEGLILVEMTRALKINLPISNADNEIRTAAIRETVTSISLNPGAFAEFDALPECESGKSPISALELQEDISDYEALGGGKVVSPLISFYIAESKIKVLNQRQRYLCYVMIKSAMRQIRATNLKE